MKKFLCLLCITLILNSCVFAENNNLISPFSEDKYFGLKDYNGNIIVKPEYTKLIRLGNSSWIAQKKNRFGLLDNSGNWLIEPKYRHVDRLMGKYLKIGNENNFAIYDEHGKVIIPPEYTSIDPLFGGMFLTKKNYKYGLCDKTGKVILDNLFDDIYMPQPNIIRLEYNGQWYEIEQIAGGTLELPEDVKNIKYNDKFKVTTIVKDPMAASGYSVVTFTDYFLKIFSSISPSHEETIDELMFSQGADTVSILMKMTWLPKYPYTFAKKYYHNIRTPNNGPLIDVRNELKQKMQ